MSAPYHTQECNGINCRCLQDHLDWVDECDVESPFEIIAHWLVVILATVGTLAVCAGVAGYFLG